MTDYEKAWKDLREKVRGPLSPLSPGATFALNGIMDDLELLYVSPAPPQAPPPELSDSMIMQMIGEADAAVRRAGQDALAIGCTPQQVYEIERDARCETIRSYLYQAGILPAVSSTPYQVPESKS